MKLLKRTPENKLYLGLDTSAYTTSLALVDDQENMLCDSRKLLPVAEGERGMRQSEAVFAHLQNLPVMLEKLNFDFSGKQLMAVAVAEIPRPVEGSYMPVFKVGEALGLFLAKIGAFKYVQSSHQEGHIMAGLWSAALDQGPYLVLHLSGGTTEFLSVEEVSPGRLSIKLLGGTCDLNAGQFVDRIGTALGLTFPAGPALELLAAQNEGELPHLPVAVKDGRISFSGPASHAERLLEKGCSGPDLARAVELCIAQSIVKALQQLMTEPGRFKGLLAVGGVMANGVIRQQLTMKLPQWKVIFADPLYSSDNAVGLAVQARRIMHNESSLFEGL